MAPESDGQSGMGSTPFIELIILAALTDLSGLSIYKSWLLSALFLLQT